MHASSVLRVKHVSEFEIVIRDNYYIFLKKLFILLTKITLRDAWYAYNSVCPAEHPDNAFYLAPLAHPKENCRCCKLVVVASHMKSASISGYFSLCDCCYSTL